MNKKILINGLLLSDLRSGIHHSLEQLLWAMEQSIPQEQLLAYLPTGYSGRLREMTHIEPNFISISGESALQRLMTENTLLVNRGRSEQAAIFHGPAAALPLRPVAQKHIITIHDLLAFEQPHLCQRRTLLYHRTLLPGFIKKADAIIAVSQTVKESIHRHFHVPDEKVKVIYHGIGHEWQPCTDQLQLQAVRHQYQLPENYILFLGNLESKKNIGTLVRAFTLLQEQTGFTHKLVLAGRPQWGYAAIKKIIAQQPQAQHIIETGPVAAAHLAALCSMASLFVFPSWYEGFGIPPLEAMACGLPVIVSNGGALPEITGDAAWQLSPGDAAALANAMLTMLTDTYIRNNFVEKGLARVKLFTWKHAADETLSLYQSVLYN
jgi:glycosyltransferase involved in cell wall biosynthesis